MKKKLLVILSFFLILSSNLTAKKYKPAFDLQQFISDAKTNYSISIERKYKHYAVLPEGWKNSDVGFILYPGAYVDFECYLPLLEKIAERGIPCFITRMPHDLAIIDSDRADVVFNDPDYNHISQWYIGGHSLGGVEAGWYACKGKNEIAGVVLIAAYTIYDFNKSAIPVICIYGDKDGVLSVSKYEKYKKMLPNTYIEYVIHGGNHAQFGVYGEQKGDNPADISSEEQLELTAECIADFCR